MMPRRVPPASGIAPFDGVRSIQELVARLQPFFLSSSLGSAPGASATATGGRTVVTTNRGAVASQPRPQDSTSIALVAGTLTWTFTTKFVNSPIVTFSPVGVPPSGATLYVSAEAPNAVTITSTVNTDTRTVNLSAVGNPN